MALQPRGAPDSTGLPAFSQPWIPSGMIHTFV
jgi:hypothetical protein